MENNFKQFIYTNKGFIAFYLIWFLLHLILVSIGGDSSSSDFWPFQDSDIYEYNLVEFIFYLIAPIPIWCTWKLYGGDITKLIKQYKNKYKNKYDYSYEKETGNTTAGVFLLLPFEFTLFVPLFDPPSESPEFIVVPAICLLVIRIFAVIQCVKVAERQNRNKGGWGFFAFFMPSIALIIIGLLRKLKKQVDTDL